MVVPTGKCGICGVPTNQSFPYYCDAHREELFEKVTGTKPQEPPRPKF